MPFFWMVTLVSAGWGGWLMFNTVFLAKSAPQEAAGAAMAVGFAVIPYVFTRCIEAMTIADWRKDLLKAVERLARAPASPSVAPSPSPYDRLMAEPVAAPATRPHFSRAASIGNCPGCGKIRGTNVPKCIYCGNTDPVPVVS